MEAFINKKYKMEKSEHFEEYLTFTGKSFIARKAALGIKPTEWLARAADGTYTYSMSSPLASTTSNFLLGEEFQDTKADGTKVTAVITFEGNKMTHVQKDAAGVVTTHVREFFPDKMIVHTTVTGFDKTFVRYYKSE